MTSSQSIARRVLKTVSDWALLNVNSRPNTIQQKQDRSRVTDVDLAVHIGISKLLNEELPNCVVLSEEGEMDFRPPATGWVAVLDPIDGTENFIDGRVEWCICLSLYSDGMHAASALILPSIGDCLISGDDVPQFKSNTMVLSAAMVGKSLPQNFRGARVTGSAGWNFYHVIQGSYKAFISPPNLRCWDIQAGACLAVEAGCAVRINGAAYDLSLLDNKRRYSVEVTRPN